MRTRSDIIILGKDTVIDFPEGFFEKLSECLEELAKNIENNQDTYAVLQKISLLAYISTGNGYYLYQKGILKIWISAANLTPLA